MDDWELKVIFNTMDNYKIEFDKEMDEKYGSSSKDEQLSPSGDYEDTFDRETLEEWK